MNYLLSMLTHGDHATELRATLDAFLQHASPLPVAVNIYGDGEQGYANAYDLAHEIPRRMANAGEAGLGGASVLVDGTHEQRGFCAATRACWEEAAASTLPYVFHGLIVSAKWIARLSVAVRCAGLAAGVEGITSVGSVTVIR